MLSGVRNGWLSGVKSGKNTERCCMVIDLQFYKIEKVLKATVSMVTR